MLMEELETTHAPSQVEYWAGFALAIAVIAYGGLFI